MSSDRTITNKIVTAVIGGVTYSLLLSDIQAHGDCYFASAIKDVWNNNKQPIAIDRDGILFQHIYAYMYNCRNGLPFVATGFLEVLTAVRREADFYNFPELVALYDKACIQELHKWCKLQPLSERCDSYVMDLTCEVPSELSLFVNSEVYPSCHLGMLGASPEQDISHYHALVDKIYRHRYRSVVLGSELRKPKVFELANLIPYETLLKNVAETMPKLLDMEYRVQNGKLWGCIEGGFMHYDPVGPTNPNRIGTIVCTLNYAYTGGAITATWNGVSKSITQPGEYIIYTTEYALDISTVTSGVLLYAQFDIWHQHTKQLGYCTARLDLHRALPCRSAFMEAVRNELSPTNTHGNSNKVVLCLSTLYPIVDFDPAGPYLGTDADSLTDRDAEVYEYLKDIFEVTLVTVYVQRNRDERSTCVIVPAPPTSDTRTRTRIFAPFHNFRESFAVYRNQKYHFCTLYTALYITAK